VRKL
jgi:hypothetical protein